MNMTDCPVCDCPVCGKRLDAATGNHARGPAPEDITICLYCSGVLAFNDDLTLRIATDEEVRNAVEHSDLLEFLKRISDLRDAGALNDG